MSKKTINYPEYIQAYVPDTEELAILVAKAKGPDRSMAEFSRVCKVKGPSTFSRIVNELIDKPVSDELLFAIAQNAADPKEVTLDMLMRANGKVPKEELSGNAQNNDRRKAYKTQAEKVKQVKEIIVQSYLDKGEAVMLHPDLTLSEKIPPSNYALSYPSDFSIHLQGKDPLYWNFIVDLTDMHTVSLKAKADNKKQLGESMRRYAPLFLRDAWESETLKDFENSFVFIEEKAYKTFVEMMKGRKFNTKMSVMLVDLERKEEYKYERFA